MISFEPSEDQRLIVQTVAEFAKTTLSPRARAFERDGAVPEEVRRTAHEMGLSLAALPEELGGQGLGLLGAVLINEELACGDAAAPFGLAGFGSYLLAVEALATPERARELIEPFTQPTAHDTYGAVAWSEPKAHPEREGFVTVARADGESFVLDGQKCFVGNAHQAEQFVVFAQVDEEAGWNGFGAFLIDKSNPGLKLGKRHETLGLGCASFGEVAFAGARVDKSDRLLGGGDLIRSTVDLFTKYSLTVAARQVGLSRAAFEITREYCDIRKAFGKPIGHFQAVAFTLADRHMDTESAAALVRRAAWAWDSGLRREKAWLYSSQAVAQAHVGAMCCADDAVQLHGGAGFMRDVIVEKMMRDTKQMALVGMTAEQMDQLATAVELRSPLDPGRVLPTPDTQAIFS